MPEEFTDGDQLISTGMNKFYEHVRLFYKKVVGYVEILGKVLHFLIQKTVGAKKGSRCHSGFKAS